MKKALSVISYLAALLACQDMQSQKDLTEMTSSGYRYDMLHDAQGETAQVGQYLLVHTVMSHQDSVISNTRDNPGRPTVVKIEEEEKRRQGASGPIQDLCMLLSEGDSVRFYYPLDSFQVKPRRLEGFDEVTYDIKVVDIFTSDDELQAYFDAEREKDAEMRSNFAKQEAEIAEKVNAFYDNYKSGKTKDWQTTESGLKYVLLEKGGTGVTVPAGEIARVHYYGFLEQDATPFDNSYKRGEPISFPVGKGAVIKGWDEAFQILEKGDKAVLLIPSDLAYGSQGIPGVIPANASLMFYVELVGVGEME